jgi:DNA-binding response OmpR family regulator
MRLLLAESDSALAEFLKSRFQEETFTVSVLPAPQDVAKVADSELFDLILVDLDAPASSGSDRLHPFQRRWPDSPLIILAAEASVEERVRVLNAGADDFVAKPFAVAELVARARAVLRRRSRPEHDLAHFDDLVVNRVSHQVCRAGRTIELSPREYALLDFLLRNAGQPVSRASIIEEVWRMQTDSLTNVVEVYINYLRRKIDSGSDRPLIRTIRGVGYQIGGHYFTSCTSSDA